MSFGVEEGMETTSELRKETMDQITTAVFRLIPGRIDDMPVFPMRESDSDYIPWDAVRYARDYSVEMRCGNTAYKNTKGFHQTGAYMAAAYKADKPVDALLHWICAWVRSGTKEYAFDESWHGQPWILKSALENELLDAGYGGWHTSSHSMFRRPSARLMVPKTIKDLAYMALLDYLAHIGMGWNIVVYPLEG